MHAQCLEILFSIPACTDCIGLSGEVRMVRLVLERGYTSVAISSNNRRGCWSLHDIPRIETALRNSHFNSHRTIIAIGASSGGFMAAQLMALQKVQEAVVMVMSLPPQLLSKLSTSPSLLFFAPMPRDKATTKRVILNYHTLVPKTLNNGSSIILDTTTCTSLPLTPKYLLQRVPGMTLNYAQRIYQHLQQNNHLHPITNMFIKDPTTSAWRKQLSPNNDTHLFGRFVLKPGYSSLAKVFHRAWAFHEYCSEVVHPSLDFFEQQFIVLP